MTASARLVERSGDLKGELLAYARQPRFAPAFEAAYARQFGDRRRLDEAAFAAFLDAFILQHRLPNGRTVVSYVVEDHPGLPEDEREMLLAWQDAVEGIFEVERRDGDAIILVNLIDELTYRTRSNMGRAAMAPMKPGSFVITRLVPIGDEWLLSGISSLLAATYRQEAYARAAEVAARHPALLFRNQVKLAQGWELQREERRHFVEWFGSDLIVVPGTEVADRMRAFTHFRVYEVRDSEGRTAAERAKETLGQVLAPPEFEVPPDVAGAESVGLLYDEEDGLNFLLNFGQVQAAVADPTLVRQRRYREAVLSYLEDDSIPPSAWRRLAAADPSRATRLLQQLLKRPTFDWERDGEALLREFKPAFFERPALPSVIPISDQLARAQQAARAEREAPRQGRPAPRGGRKRRRG